MHDANCMVSVNGNRFGYLVNRRMAMNAPIAASVNCSCGHCSRNSVRGGTYSGCGRNRTTFRFVRTAPTKHVIAATVHTNAPTTPTVVHPSGLPSHKDMNTAAPAPHATPVRTHKTWMRSKRCARSPSKLVLSGVLITGQRTTFPPLTVTTCPVNKRGDKLHGS